jgi:hypothetical protein
MRLEMLLEPGKVIVPRALSKGGRFRKFKVVITIKLRCKFAWV